MQEGAKREQQTIQLQEQEEQPQTNTLASLGCKINT
jgi:hypothetical protein